MKLDFRKPADRETGRRAWYRMAYTPDGGSGNASLAIQWMAYCDRVRRLYYL